MAEEGKGGGRRKEGGSGIKEGRENGWMDGEEKREREIERVK